ncbi:MAG: universal stress protein, partial [Bacteroidales bacterium]|nr:universal stress protein [Bacteroidales bacterium]
MKLLQNILVTIDFSESSEYVLENSIRLAKKFNSQISLLHVVADRHMSAKMDKFIDDTVKSQLDKIASEIEEAGVDLKNIIIEHGVPFEKIIEEVQINDYNLLVAGSLAKPDNESFKLGTTVEKLIRKNPIPIWVVKPEPLRKIKKILCPVDFSDASHRALNNAITLAQSYKAELFIQHIYPSVSISPMWMEMDYEEEKKNLKLAQEAEFDEFLAQFNMKSVAYKKVTNEGVDYQEILKFISENKIDLLLMGTTGKTGLSRILMGSTTTKVTRELPCSFITTKAKDITDDFFESYLKSLESIINSAKQSQDKEEYEKAIEKYSIALKQYPDNIPILMGSIEAYEALGNNH